MARSEYKVPIIAMGAVLTCVDSTIAVALWQLTNEPVSPTLRLVVDAVVDGGVGSVHTNNPAWAPRDAV